LIWADGAITNTWVEVTVLATANTGLSADDVFFFGNAIGEVDGDRVVGSSDYDVLTAQFGRRGVDMAADFNGDAIVDIEDFWIMRDCYGKVLSEPPVLPGDADGNGVVDDGDYEILVGQLGWRGSNLAADFNGDQRVDITDFEIMRGSFGNTLQAAAPASVVPVVSQPIRQAHDKPLGDRDANDASIAAMETPPAIDPPAQWPSAGGYISEPQPISVGLSATTLYRAATGEYDLRPLSDDPATDGQGDLLADILAESPLTVHL
jgi:hypothetical protein